MTASDGFTYAQTSLKDILYRSGDIASAERWFHLMADQGEPTAMYNLGTFDAFGMIEIDEREAMELLVRPIFDFEAHIGLPLTRKSPLRTLSRTCTLMAIIEPVVPVYYGAIDACGPRGHGIVETVTDVQNVLIWNIEMGKTQEYGVGVWLVPLGLVKLHYDLE